MSTNAAARSISWHTTTLPNGTVFQGGVLFPDSVIEERHDDDSEITENPVEYGSVSNDHAFDRPQELEIDCVWDPSRQSSGQAGFLKSTYRQVLNLKQAKILIIIVTGKRQYENMLIKHVSEITDKDTENVLRLRLTIQQLILALTQTVTISSAAQQALPQKTSPTINNGNVSLQSGANYNSTTAG